MLIGSYRYFSRFAEYYRRHLDALCIGAQLPLAPAAPEQPGGGFASGAEAAQRAQRCAELLEEAAQAASVQCGPKRRAVGLGTSRNKAFWSWEPSKNSSKRMVYGRIQVILW